MRRQEQIDPERVPRVELDIFYVGTDELSHKYEQKDGYLTERTTHQLSARARESLLSVLNVVDARSLAQGTLLADKALDAYKAEFIKRLLDSLGTHYSSIAIRRRTSNQSIGESGAVDENTFNHAERFATILASERRIG